MTDDDDDFVLDVSGNLVLVGLTLEETIEFESLTTALPRRVAYRRHPPSRRVAVIALAHCLKKRAERDGAKRGQPAAAAFNFYCDEIEAAASANYDRVPTVRDRM
jgi:hypothetical protein